jgi:hypothetical protein
MIALLLKIFMFYVLFIGFKALLSPAKKSSKSKANWTGSFKRPTAKSPSANANDDIIEAEYRVLKD